MRILSAIVTLMMLLPSSVHASCTVIAVHSPNGSIGFLGKSYDWESQAAIVTLNLTGLTKRAFLFPSKEVDVPEEAVTWKSALSSITFNQYGRDFPLAGMNSAGLVVETAEMDPGSTHTAQANYTPPNATKVITSNQWVQYILDTYGSVQDFMDDLPTFAIVYSKVPVHFMICDQQECVVVEFRNNDLQIARGLDLGIQPSDGAFISVPVLTNDYYKCSLRGRSGDVSWSLADYEGFGGTRSPIPHYPGFCDGTNQKPHECDLACRSDGAWLNSNSVQRFISAADSSKTLSAMPSGAAVGDLFDALNRVYSKSRETGGSKIQIVYDLAALRIHWRTIADGTDESSAAPTGMTGTLRSVSFADFETRGLLKPCKSVNDALVASIDSAPACANPPQSHTCNPNPDLSHRLQLEWPWTNYEESWNTDLVTFAAANTSISTSDVLDMVKGRLSGISDANARKVLYSIWGGYPRGYTACGQDVVPEQVVNLFLSSVLDPYITPKARAKVTDPMTTDSSGSGTYNNWNYTWSLKNLKISGAKHLEITKVAVSNGPKCGSDDCFTINGTFKEGTLDLGTPYTVYAYTGNIHVATVTIDTLKVKDVSFAIPGTGAHVNDDYSGSFCFRSDAKVKEPVVSFSIPNDSQHWKCKAWIFGVRDDDPCGTVRSKLQTSIKDKIRDEVKSNAQNNLLPALPQCGTVTVSPSAIIHLTTDWGPLASQRLTARVGHTYILRGRVTADSDSTAWQFVTFDQIVPGTSAPQRIASIRMTAHQGINEVTALWTPTSAGDTHLLLDALRWNEPTDELAPLSIPVRVFPENGPTTWVDMMYESMSTSLEEAP